MSADDVPIAKSWLPVRSVILRTIAITLIGHDMRDTLMLDGLRRNSCAEPSALRQRPLWHWARYCAKNNPPEAVFDCPLTYAAIDQQTILQCNIRQHRSAQSINFVKVPSQDATSPQDRPQLYRPELTTY